MRENVTFKELVDIEQSPVCISVLIQAIQNACAVFAKVLPEGIDEQKGPLQQRFSMVHEVNKILGEDRFAPENRMEVVHARQIAEIFFVDLKGRKELVHGADLTYSVAILVYLFGWAYNDNPEYSTKIHNLIIREIYELGNW